jgi:Domain of unknown function (DUF4837)
MKQLLLIVGILVTFVSCNSNKNQLVLKSSTGRINSMLVVIDNDQWDTAVGSTLKELINKPVLGLTQPEPQFRVTQINPSDFNSIFENNRNILIIGIANKSTFKIITNKYAAPQKIITVTGQNEADLINQIKKHFDDIKSAFNKSDLALYQQKLSKKVWDNKRFLALKNFKISIPKNYLVVENIKDFLWLRKHLGGDATMNILAYSMPIPKKPLTQLDILNKRDSIGKKYVPGQLLNSYMQISKELEPTFKPYKINGVLAYETRGLWEVKNDFMGGSFINYSFIDTKNNRVLCLDGFVYAPNKDKRDYIFELEAIFKTLKI